MPSGSVTGAVTGAVTGVLASHGPGSGRRWLRHPSQAPAPASAPRAPPLPAAFRRGPAEMTALPRQQRLVVPPPPVIAGACRRGSARRPLTFGGKSLFGGKRSARWPPAEDADAVPALYGSGSGSLAEAQRRRGAPAGKGHASFEIRFSPAPAQAGDAAPWRSAPAQALTRTKSPAGQS